jgi:hypothetical protein
LESAAPSSQAFTLFFNLLPPCKTKARPDPSIPPGEKKPAEAGSCGASYRLYYATLAPWQTAFTPSAACTPGSANISQLPPHP